MMYDISQSLFTETIPLIIDECAQKGVAKLIITALRGRYRAISVLAFY